MIEVCGVVFGCQWGSDGHVRPWPLRVRLGSMGPETTVEEMLEGRGHTVMLPSQLVELVCELQRPAGEVELCGEAPVAVVDGLLARGYRVKFAAD